MFHHPFRTCVSGLIIALCGVAESPAQPTLPNIVIEPPPSPVVTEGETSSFGVKLGSDPGGRGEATVSFSVTVTSSDLPVTFRPSTLTFDSNNWNTAQTVTVEVGHDDDAVPTEGRFMYSISARGERIDHTLPIPITILDDDRPALSLSRPRVRLVEGGNSKSYEVSLAARPTGDVAVEISLEGTQSRQISVDPEMLVFTPGTWDRARTVELQAPGGTGVAPLMDASVLHTASGALEFSGVTASLSLSVSTPLPAVSELFVRSLPDGFEVSWAPLSELVDGYRVEFLPGSGAFGTPGSNRGAFVGAARTSHRIGGLARSSVHQVRVVAFEGSELSPEYGAPSRARLVVIGDDPAIDSAVSDSADAATALVALGYGSSLIETVVARVSGDRESVAHASSAAFNSWSRAFDSFFRSSGPVLSVHESSPQERTENERAREAPRRGWWLPAGGPVERGDWLTWARADLPGLGGTVDAYSLDGSARILHLGIERSIEPPATFDRFAKAVNPDGEWLAGVGVGFASASVDIHPAGASLDHSARLVYPYLGYRDDRKLAYALVGAGLGTSSFRHPSLRPAAADGDQDSLLVVAGLGGAVVLGGRPDRAEFLVRTSMLGVIANNDANSVLPTRTVTAYRARLGLDTRHARSMGGGILSPSTGLGILYDGGDGPGGVALEADANTRFDWRRFSFSARAKTLLMSSDDLDRSLGLSGAVRYSPGSLGRGSFLTISPSYGSGSAPGSAWDGVRLPSSDPNASVFGLTAEAGYAFSAAPGPGLVTVVAGVDSVPDETSHGVARTEIRYRSRSSLATGLRHTFELGDPDRASVALHVHWSF